MAVSASESNLGSKRRRRWVLPLILTLTFFVAILGFALTLLLGFSNEREYAEMQVNAAVRMKNAEGYIKENMLREGIAIEMEDLNKTGLLGPEFTELTSTPGNPDAKRTTLVPDFAAAMVRYFHDAGLNEGDTVAIGTSGSFPGLLIAVLCGATEMGLNSRVIASVGSSMHGATRPEYNIFDILDDLKEGGFADFEILAVSPGGANDRGGGVMEGILWFDTDELSFELCRETGYPVIDIEDLGENIKHRMELYGDVDMFVNVGGASVNNGSSSYTLDFPQGLVLDPPAIPDVPTRGLIYEYAALGKPVLNLLNVRLLAEENGITFDPIPLPEPGTSRVVTEFGYNKVVISVTLVLIVGLLVLYWVLKKRGFDEGKDLI